MNLLAILLVTIRVSTMPAPAEHWISYGDSKTFGASWQATLYNRANLAKFPAMQFDWRVLTATPTTNAAHAGILARNGSTPATMQALIDADLAAMTTPPVSKVLFNLGANDMGGLPAEATWEGNVLYLLDAFRAKWPTVEVYIARPWRRGFDADSDTLAGWIGTVVAARSFAHLGPDERVTIKAGDNGNTNTWDGVHYSPTGASAWASAWVTALGY